MLDPVGIGVAGLFGSTVLVRLVSIKEALAHLDVVLREFDPSYRAETLPPKRLRRVKLFGNGELTGHSGRAQAGREAAGASREIAECIVTAKGYGGESIHAVRRRVRATCPICSGTGGSLRRGPADRPMDAFSLMPA
jgi:hypothetical protein